MADSDDPLADVRAQEASRVDLQYVVDALLTKHQSHSAVAALAAALRILLRHAAWQRDELTRLRSQLAEQQGELQQALSSASRQFDERCRWEKEARQLRSMLQEY